MSFVIISWKCQVHENGEKEKESSSFIV